MKIAGHEIDVSQVKVGLIPALAGGIVIGGWILTTLARAKDLEAAVASQDTRIEHLITIVEEQQAQDAKAATASRKLRDAVNELIVELKVRGVVTEAETAESATPE